MSEVSAVEELRGVLAAYRVVKDASWPDLHPDMAKASARWPSAGEEELRKELAGYVSETQAPGCGVRVFWKTGPGLVFGGCNKSFATDAGLSSPSEVIGLDDFSDKLPWAAQASKYRFDDKEVVDSGNAKLDILERQNSATGVVWVLVGKAPILAGDRAIGILGMYQVLDKETGHRLFSQRAVEGR
jgi:hypothetical protein